jgi:hypothetical protein
MARPTNSGDYSLPTVRAPEGYPGLTTPAAPTKRGKTPEQYEADLAIYTQAMRDHFARIAAFNRQRRVAMGLTQYRWLACDVHGTCDVAQRNGGKVFSLVQPPPDGHVGEGRCTSPDWCRCVAVAVVPGFN